MNKKKYWLNLNVEVQGKTEDDLIIAMEEVIKKVREGYSSGFDSNETGNYDFTIRKSNR